MVPGYSICRSLTPHGELDLSIWQLPPLLDNRQVAALRKLADDFASFNASRFNRQPERLPRKSVIQFPLACNSICKITRSKIHAATPQRNHRPLMPQFS